MVYPRMANEKFRMGSRSTCSKLYYIIFFPNPSWLAIKKTGKKRQTRLDYGCHPHYFNSHILIRIGSYRGNHKIEKRCSKTFKVESYHAPRF